MKITCDIIRDLLPLYAENLASLDSRTLVEEHLSTCAKCTKELESLLTAAPIPPESDIQSMAHLRRSIRNRRLLAVTTAVLVVLTLVLHASLALDAKIYLSAEDAVGPVEALADGTLQIPMSSLVVGTGSIGNGDPTTNEPTGNYGMIAFTRLSKLLFSGKDRTFVSGPVHSFKGMSSQNLWYCSARNGCGETLIWDAGNPHPTVPLGEVNYNLAYYCGGLAVIAGLLCGIAYGLRKRSWSRWIGYGALFLFCVSVSTVAACAGQFMELWGEFTEYSSKGILLSTLLYATCLCGIKLWRLNRKDRGL